MQQGRREIKFMIPLLEYMQVEPQLAVLLQQDKNADGNGQYRVRSLYFDSVNDDDLTAVLDGLNSRKKIRLRVYDSADTGIKLEYKAKQGMQQQKYSVPLTREQAEAMIAGSYGFLLDHSEPIAQIIYRDLQCGTYRPKVMIEYDRRAFDAPGNDIRITFDSGIRASCHNFNLFDSDINYTPLIAADRGVLEIKYNRFLYTYIQNILNNLHSTPSAMSKYVLSRTTIC